MKKLEEGNKEGIGLNIKRMAAKSLTSLKDNSKSVTLGQFANELRKRQRRFTAKGDPITEEDLIIGLESDWIAMHRTYSQMGITFDELIEVGKAAISDTIDPFEQPKGFETVHRIVEKIGRNKPCPCGSGVKYKKCCGRNG